MCRHISNVGTKRNGAIGHRGADTREQYENIYRFVAQVGCIMAYGVWRMSTTSTVARFIQFLVQFPFLG